MKSFHLTLAITLRSGLGCILRVSTIAPNDIIIRRKTSYEKFIIFEISFNYFLIFVNTSSSSSTYGGYLYKFNQKKYLKISECRRKAEKQANETEKTAFPK